jgi:hypothetical protein
MNFKMAFLTSCPSIVFTSGVPLKADESAIHNKFVEKCLRDFESIKLGMTRSEIEKKFLKDGGLQSVSPVRYAHPICSYFKIDIEFDFQSNASDQGRAIVGKRDKVIKVSRPYIERPFLD